MNELRTDWSGTSEDLVALLARAAGNFGGWAGKDRKTGDHILQFGTFLSTNTNTLRWRARVRQDGNQLSWKAESLTWPWTRAKYRRVTDFRLGQLTDFVENLLRGGKNIHRFESPSTRNPFVAVGREISGITIAWTWLILSCLVCGVLSWIAMTLGSLLLIDRVIATHAERSALVATLGGVALPSLGEIAETGFLFRLGCAASFAFAIAFFVGSAYGLIQVAGELWAPLSRAAWVPFAFFTCLLFLALFPILAIHSTIAISLLVPTVAHAGYTLVWGRKREKRSALTPSKPKWMAVVAGIALAGIVLGAITPRPREGSAVTDSMAGFRDRYLLPNPVGEPLARLYYRTTLYAAAPMKDFYDPEPLGYARQIRIALLAGNAPEVERNLRRMHFVLDKTAPEKLVEQAGRKPYDLVLFLGPGTPPSDDVLAVPADISLEALRKKVSGASRDSFRASWLRDMAQVGWLSVFYLGPFALFSFLAAFLLPGISLLFRKFSRRAAVVALAGLCLGSVAALGLVLSANGPKLAAIRTIQSAGLEEEKTPERLKPFLTHEDPDVRFEAILRLHRFAKGRKERTTGMTDAVIRLLEDPDRRVRLWACGTLGKLRDPAGVKHLLAAMQDPEVFVRYRAAEGLGDLRARAAIEPLKKMAREDWWYCGMYALEALRKIRPEQF